MGRTPETSAAQREGRGSAPRPRATACRRRHLPAGRLGLALLALIAVFAAGAIGRATTPALAATTILVVGTTTDSGSLTTCSSTPSANCSLRGAITLANTNASAATPYEIDLPAGTYILNQNELQVGTTSGNSITIKGTSGSAPGDTTIQQATPGARIFNIDPNLVGGITVSIANLTLSGGSGGQFGGGAILAGGDSTDSLAVTGSVLSNNSQSAPFNGGAIAFGGGGNLTVGNSTFSNNTSGGNGGAIDFDDATSTGSLSISGSTFSGNKTATGGQGGALYVNLIGPSTATITGSAFIQNQAQAAAGDPNSGKGGALFLANGNVTVNVSRISGNTAANGGSGVFSSGSLTANDNFWGCNTGPGTSGCDAATAATGASATTTTYLVLKAAASPTSVNPNGTSTVTADLTVNNSGGLTSGSGHVPDGTSIGFAVSPSGIGSLSLSSANTTAGTTTTVFTAGSSGGTATVTATLDNASAPATIGVNTPPAITTQPSNQSVNAGATATFTAAASGSPTPTVQWQVSTDSGAHFTDITGNATATTTSLSFTAQQTDSGNQYRAVFTNVAGTATTNAATLTVGTPPAFTSADHTTFTVGTAGSFTVTTTGSPTATLSAAAGTGSTIPSGITFVDNGDGTGKFSGTPAASTPTQPNSGTFAVVITAHNAAGTTTQNFTLTVDEAPTFTSQNALTGAVGQNINFPITTIGFPLPTITESGALPSGVQLVHNLDGTYNLAGTPAAGSGGSYTLTLTAQNGVGSNATQTFTLIISEPPAITSANSATFIANQANSFTVTTAGFPKPSIGETGALPSGVTLVDNHDGTATLSGAPAAGTGGVYHLTLSATNTAAQNPATQSFTLTVNEAPTITSPDHTAFKVGVAGSFTVTTSGFPTNAALTEAGSLPSGVSFHDNGDGSATIAGTPASGSNGSYPLTLTANNGVTPNGTQSFTLTVATAATSISLSVSPTKVQYSDQVTLTATVTGLVSGTLHTGGTVNFFIGGEPAGTAPVADSGSDSATVSVEKAVDLAPNVAPQTGYDISATFTPTISNFTGNSTTVPNGLTVTQEDASVTYTGDPYAVTPDGTVAMTTLSLSATVTGAPDSFPGDITKATVTFVDRGNNNATLCTAAVGLLTAETGAASCNATVNLGSASSATFKIGVVVGGYYAHDSSSDYTSVMVTRNTTNTKVDGSATLVASGSAGKYAADNGSTISMSLTAQDKGHNNGNNNGNNNGSFSGTLTVTLHSGGKTIQIASTAVTQVAESGSNKAVVNATATATDVTDAAHPVVLDSAALVQLTLLDNQGNAPDKLSIAVYGSGTNSGLTFAANWNGTQSLEQNVASGRLKVH